MTSPRQILPYVITLCLIIILSACKSEVNYTPPEGSTEIAITHFSYDKLIIKGEVYDIDLMILPNGKITSWGFDRDTHRIVESDIQSHITEDVKTVIIGCGLHGEGFLDDEAQAYVKELEAKGIAVHFLDTIEAVNMFNASAKDGLLSFFHVRN